MQTELLQFKSTLNFRATSKNVIMGTFACIISSCSTKSGYKKISENYLSLKYCAYIIILK